MYYNVHMVTFLFFISLEQSVSRMSPFAHGTGLRKCPNINNIIAASTMIHMGGGGAKDDPRKCFLHIYYEIKKHN